MFNNFFPKFTVEQQKLQKPPLVVLVGYSGYELYVFE